jgi:NAD(P)-dependent dehydrogenase (short-subunit alcohol dehydrogenase family)
MRQLSGKVAVITGAANGIGRAIAERCAREGMRVVLAGINETTLAEAERALLATGASVLSVRADVARREDVDALAAKTLATFGAVDLLVNNAGVGGGGSVLESTWADWEWIMGVNFWGVLHGIKVFVPTMLAQGTEGHVVNVASIAGFLPYHPSAAYQVTKHAVVALSEHLYHALAHQSAKIRTSVVCPGWVKTTILDSARNRPAELRNPPTTAVSPQRLAAIQRFREALATGMAPEECADRVIQAVREERFYVLTHPEFNAAVQKRMEDILMQRNPSTEATTLL